MIHSPTRQTSKKAWNIVLNIATRSHDLTLTGMAVIQTLRSLTIVKCYHFGQKVHIKRHTNPDPMNEETVQLSQQNHIDGKQGRTHPCTKTAIII